MSNQLLNIYPTIMAVMSLISQGETKTRACDECGIGVATYDKYVRENAELHALAEESGQRGYDALADRLLHIDTDPKYANSDPKVMKVISDNIKWYLSKRDIKRYGDRVSVDVNITADKAVIAALNRGIDRAHNRITDAVDVAYTVVEPASDDTGSFAFDPEMRQFVGG